MNNVINIALPIFGLGILGYLATRLGYFSENAAEGLARFVFDYAVPAMLIRVFANTQLPDQIPWGLLGSFYLPAYSLYLIGLLLSGLLFRHLYMEKVITGFACVFGNLVLIGLPIVTLTFGEQATVPFFIIVSLHGLGFIPLSTVLMEFGRNSGGSLPNIALKVMKSLLRNPLIVALIIGVSLNQTATSLPLALDTMISYLQQAVIPCAIFSLGASLSHYGIVGRLKAATFIVIVKNLLFPLLVWLVAARVFQLSLLWQMVVVLMASQPIGVTVYLLAERYQAGKELATTAIFLSSILSMFTITFLLYWFHYIGLSAH